MLTEAQAAEFAAKYGFGPIATSSTCWCFPPTPDANGACTGCGGTWAEPPAAEPAGVDVIAALGGEG